LFDTVVIAGVGNIGLCALQAARRYNPGQLIALDTKGRLTAGRTVKRLRRDVAQAGRAAPLAPMSGPATTTTGDDAPASRARLRE
jgi:hypothetical protein